MGLKSFLGIDTPSVKILVDDCSHVSELLTQLGEAIKVMEDHKDNARKAQRVVAEIMDQLRSASEHKDRAFETLRTAQADAQSIINDIGSIKLEVDR